MYEEGRAVVPWRWIRARGARDFERLTGLIASAVCCHVFAADLQVEAVRISDMEAVVGVGSRAQAPALQFCLDRAFIPSGDCVRDVVDARGRNLRGSVSRNNESVAVIEYEAALLPSVRNHFQAEEVSVKIAGLGVVC